MTDEQMRAAERLAAQPWHTDTEVGIALRYLLAEIEALHSQLANAHARLHVADDGGAPEIEILDHGGEA